MTTLLQWFTSPEWAQVVKALLHSLWQGALIALVLAILLRRLTNPVTRYRISLVALAALAFATITAWAVINSASHQPPPPTHNLPLVAQPTLPDSVAAPPPDSEPKTVILVAHQTTATVRWTAWLAFAWLAGAILMMARAGIKVAGAERLRRSCRSLENARIETLLVETRRALGIANRIPVGVTDKLTSPAVVGIVVPMLILPLALLTTLTPEQIRFVLLHELAHIRRRDYLANLFQFLAESLLFFNPAVWWISHQIRREREACCDALATELSGAPADYAQTLVHVAEKILYPAPAAATAFGNRHEPSSLAERVQRLLVPGYRPSLRLTWRAMLAALVFGSILLFLSAIGTRLTVAAILTPQQRIDAIEKKMAEYGQKPEGGAQSSKGPLFVTAHVRTPDGSPLPEKRQGTLYEKSGNSSSVNSLGINKDGAFGGNATHPGEIWVAAYVDGFAPAIAGPFDATYTNRLDVGELVLDRGFDVTIRLRDAASGKPLPDAALHTQFWLPGATSTFQQPEDLKTDSNGETILHHCADQPLSIVVNAPGHEIVDQRFENVPPGKPIELKLRTGAQIAGIVTDKSTGQPIAGATVRIVYQKGSTTRRFEWNDPIGLLATTGNDGRYVANQLQPATVYWLGVSAPGHESIILSNLLSGARDLNVRLGPELIVRGQVLGDVESLGRINNRYAFYREWIEQFDNEGLSTGELVPLEDANGVMRFEFTNRTAGTAELVDGKGRRFDRQVDAPVDNWVIDLNEVQKTAAVSNVPKREVIFRFKDPSGAPLTRGTVSVQVPNDVDPRHGTAHMEDMEITNGEVHAQIPIGGSTAVEPKQMIGYWFSRFGLHGELNSIDVSNGPGPIVINVPILPAGAIYAKARNADGTPAGELLFAVEEVKRAPNRSENVPFTGGNDSTSDNLPRKWVSPPLPLGGTYSITGWRGYSFCVSKPVTVTGENPVAEVELQFLPGKTFEGVLLDFNGHSIANASLKPSFTLANSHGFSWSPIFTDEDGHFRMENLTPGLGDYTIEADVPGMTAERVKLDFHIQPQTIRLEAGRRIAGYLVESNTSNVLPGAQIRAAVLGNNKLPVLTTQTDADGHFEFTQADKGDYQFFLDCGVPASQQTYRGNVDTNITLAVKLYPWTTVKPVPRASWSTGNAGRVNVAAHTSVRLFNVDSNTLYQLAQKDGKPSIADNLLNSRQPLLGPGARPIWFPGLGKLAGVMLDPPNEVVYSWASGILSVRATQADLDKIEAALARFSSAPSQTNQIGTVEMVQLGKLMFQLDRMDEALAWLTEALKRDPNNEAGLYYFNVVNQRLRLTDPGNSNLVGPLPQPNAYARTNFVYTSPQRQKIYQKLNNITFANKISFPNLPLSEVIRELTDQTALRDPDREGINFIISKVKAGAPSPPIPGYPTFDPRTGQPYPSTAPTDNIDLSDVRICLDPGIKNVRLMDVLEAIVKTADHPIKYSILDYGIQFSFKGHEQPELFTRTFKIDPTTFDNFDSPVSFQIRKLIGSGTNSSSAGQSVSTNRGLRYVTALDPTTDVQTRVINFFDAAGVSLSPPKSVFYNDRQGTLTVHAAADDLDAIEQCLSALNSSEKTGTTPNVSRQTPGHSRTNLIYTSTEQQKTLDDLKTITVDFNLYPGITLSEALRDLTQQVEQRDANHRGINFVLNRTKPVPAESAADSGVPAPAWTNDVDLGDVKINQISLNPRLINVPLTAVLNAIVKTADHPIQYSVLDYGVEFYFHPYADPPKLETRTFKIDPNRLLARLGHPTPVDLNEQNGQAIEHAVFDALTNAGFNLWPPRRVFFNPKNGYLIVRATADKLDAIEKVLSEPNDPAKTGTDNTPANQTTQSTAQKASPNEIAAEVQDAKLLFQRGNYDEAEAKFRQTLESDPDNEPARYYLRLIKLERARNTTNSDSTNLYTRYFKLDPNTFYMGLNNLGLITFPTPSIPLGSPSVATNQGRRYVSVVDSADPTPAIRTAFTNLLTDIGVNLDPPKSVHFSDDRQGMRLTVQATAADLDLVEAAVQTLNASPPRVMIKARFIETEHGSNWLQQFPWYPKTAATNEETFVGILTEPLLKDVLDTLKRGNGAPLLKGGEVITLSGRQAQFQIVDIGVPPPHMPLVVFVSTNSAQSASSEINFDGTNILTTNTRGRPVQLVYDTNTEPVGVILDVHPDVTEDQTAVQLALVATMREFAGYGVGPERDGVRHMMPKYREAVFTNHCTLYDGQTAVFAGKTIENTWRMNEKVPLLGDLPFIGHLFRTPSADTRKNIAVLVTVTIIDAAGNRTNPSDAERPFSRVALDNH